MKKIIGENKKQVQSRMHCVAGNEEEDFSSSRRGNARIKREADAAPGSLSER